MEAKFHKVFLIILKCTPFIVALAYFICVMLSCFGISTYIIPTLFFLSPVAILFFICSSFAFKFCIWHRLPIYYSIILYIINSIDYYINLPIIDNIMLFIYLMITITFILVGMYLKNRYNKKKRNGQIRAT